MYKQGVRTLEHQIIDSVTRFCKAHHVNTKEDIYRISAISVSPSTVYTGVRITEHKIDGCLPPVQNFPAWEETVKLFVGGDGHQDTTFQHLPHYGMTSYAIKNVVD